MTATNTHATMPSIRPTASQPHLTAGVIVAAGLVLATGALAALALAAHSALYFGIDLTVARAVQAYSAEWFRVFMMALSWPGFVPQIDIAVVLICVLLYLAYSRWAAVSFVFAALGVAGAQWGLKVLVDRPRPSPDVIWVADPSLIGTQGLSLGFPAGHPASALATFGFLWVLAYVSAERSFRRTLFLVVLGAFLILVGYSRIYEGAHWFSDVIAGYLLGGIWLVITLYFYAWGKTRFLLHKPHQPHPAHANEPGAAAHEVGAAQEGFLARLPALGLELLLLGSLLFAILAVNVRTNGPLLAWDEPIIQALHRYATQDSWIGRGVMRFSATLGRETAVGITGLLVLYWLWKRRWHLLSLLLLGVIGGNIWFEVLSQFFGRHRPVFPDPLDPLPGPGFPSGHSMTAMLLYGLILYLLLPRLRSWRWRLLAALDAVLIVLLVGFSRLYTGSHFPTDVLGGYPFGLAWGALVYTGLELYHQHRSTLHREASG
jgi:membrane-associated phospholipid phosphatase